MSWRGVADCAALIRSTRDITTGKTKIFWLGGEIVLIQKILKSLDFKSNVPTANGIRVKFISCVIHTHAVGSYCNCMAI